jgi:hypothetical protein
MLDCPEEVSSRMNFFCPRGHNKMLVGTYKDYQCKACTHDRSMVYRLREPYKYRFASNKFQIKVVARFNALKNKPCADCQGWFEPCQMDFDHRPGTIKYKNVGNLVHCRKLLMEEIKKCDLVCANCHRLRTRSRKRA